MKLSISDIGIIIILGILVYNFFKPDVNLSGLEQELVSIKKQIAIYDSTARASRDTLKIIEREKTKVFNKYYKIYESNKNVPDSLIWVDFIKRVNGLYPARFVKNSAEGERASD